MRQLQLKATSSKKRTSDEVPEQLEKRVKLSSSGNPSRHSCRTPFSVQEHGEELGQALGRPETYREVSERAGRQLKTAGRLTESCVSLPLAHSPPSLTRLVSKCFVYRLGLAPSATPAPPKPDVPSTSELTPQKTAPPQLEDTTGEGDGDESSTTDTPKKVDAEPPLKKKKTKGQAPTRSSPRKQVAKRATGAPKKSPLENLEETLAAGGTVDVNLSEDSDNLDINEVHDDASDDEVSLAKFTKLH